MEQEIVERHRRASFLEKRVIGLQYEAREADREARELRGEWLLLFRLFVTVRLYYREYRRWKLETRERLYRWIWK